uniref:RHS repeat-associated core domain-containing protein n=1 Tax=Listeria newyorkensis TaxID=1497681 RepID=UPI0028C439CA
SEATTDYRFGEDDQILGTEDESYHENGLTDIATSSDGEESTDYDYTDYGTAIAAVPMANQIGYRAQMHDTNDTQNLRARNYDTNTGRFLQADSYRGALDDPRTQNRYIYGGNNPNSYGDPSGHFMSWLKKKAKKVKNKAKKLKKKFSKSIKRGIKKVKKAIKRTVKKVKRVIKKIKRAAKKIYKKAKRAVKKAVTKVKRAVHKFKKAAKKSVRQIKKVAKKIYKKAKVVLKKVQKVAKKVKRIVKTIKKAGIKQVRKAFSYVKATGKAIKATVKKQLAAKKKAKQKAEAARKNKAYQAVCKNTQPISSYNFSDYQKSPLDDGTYWLSKPGNTPQQNAAATKAYTAAVKNGTVATSSGGISNDLMDIYMKQMLAVKTGVNPFNGKVLTEWEKKQFAYAGAVGMLNLGYLGVWGSGVYKKNTPIIANSQAQNINPSKIRFSQSSVNGSAEIIKSMKEKGWNGNPIDVVKMSDGMYTTIDNTRVAAARVAGIEVKANIRNFNDLLPADMVDRFTTKKGVPKTWGEALELRIQKQNAGFRNNNPMGSYELEKMK